MERENNFGLQKTLEIVSLAEKKARIYSRLLTETSLAKAMERLACRHEKQTKELGALLGKKDAGEEK